MEQFLIVMQILALGCISALSIYLIAVLVRVRSFLSVLEKDFKELTSKAIPVFENLEIITSKIKQITESIDEDVSMVKHSIRSFKTIVDTIVDFERRVQERIESPVMETVGVFSAVLKGVRTFVERLGF